MRNGCKAHLCTASNVYLGQSLGIDAATVARAISELEGAGAVERVEAKGKAGRKLRGLRAVWGSRFREKAESNRYNIASSKHSEEEAADVVEDVGVMRDAKGDGPTSSSSGDDVARAQALLAGWPAQVMLFMQSAKGSPVPPASPEPPERTHLLAVMTAAAKAYPDADVAQATRHLARACAATQPRRDNMRTQANHPVYGAQFVDLRLCIHTGPKGTLLKAAGLGSTRQPPEPIPAEEIAAVPQEAVDAVAKQLSSTSWVKPKHWRSSIREIAARCVRYGVDAETYVRCADLLHWISECDVPFLWIADSLPRDLVPGFVEFWYELIELKETAID